LRPHNRNLCSARSIIEIKYREGFYISVS
jgi:hypothetical protein